MTDANKIIWRSFSSIFVCIFGMLPDHVFAACDGANIEGPNHCVYVSGLGVVGGGGTTATIELLATNMYPFSNFTFAEDRTYWRTYASNAYQDGINFRNQTLALWGVQKPTIAIRENMSAQEKLLFYPRDNYETVGLVAVKDTNGDGVLDDCTLNGGDLERRLEGARDVFAYEASIGLDPAAKGLLRESVKLLANIYLTAADEFLVDSLEYRYSATPVSGSDMELPKQIKLLKQAEVCYNKAIKSFMYGYGQPLGNGGYLSDYFDESVDSLFYIAIERMSISMRERSSKELLYSLSPGALNLVSSQKASLGILRDVAINTYLMGAIVAENQRMNSIRNPPEKNEMGVVLQGIQPYQFEGTTREVNFPFVRSGGDRLQGALKLLRQQAAGYRSGRNPLGYDERYVPVGILTKDLITLADEWVVEAAKSEAKVLGNRERLDVSVDSLRKSLIDLVGNEGGYGKPLATITGVSISSLDFVNKAAQFGDSLVLCKIDDPEFDTCVTQQLAGQDKGVVGVTYTQIRKKYLELQLATLRRENYQKSIEIETEQLERLKEIEIKYGERVIGTLRKFFESSNRARGNGLFNSIVQAASVAAFDYFSVGTRIAAVLGINTDESANAKEEGARQARGALRQGASAIAGAASSYAFSMGDASTSFSKESELQQAMTDYRIAVLDATFEAKIKNMLNTIVEYDRAIGIAGRDLATAIDEYENIMRERDDLVYLYRKAKAYIELNNDEVKNRIAEARILKSQSAIELGSQLDSAVRYAYWAAKTLEYSCLTPLVNVGPSGKEFSLSELYKAQTPENVKEFLLKLKGYDITKCASPTSRRLVISLGQQILGFNEEVLKGSGISNESDRVRFRTEKVQEFLIKNRVEIPGSETTERARNAVRFSFSNSVTSEYLQLPGLFNAKIGEISAGGAFGVTLYLQTRQAGKMAVFGTLRQKGHSTFLKRTKISTNQSVFSVVEYIPFSSLTAIANGYDTQGWPLIAEDTFQIQYGSSDPFNTSVNQFPYWSDKFRDRSIASSDWEVLIQDAYPNAGALVPIDWSKVQDIVIYMDAYSYDTQ